MKLIILRSNLKEVLASVERAVTDSPTLPILKNILLKVDTRLTVQATNLEIGVTATTSAKITEQGILSVPFAPLYSIINNSVSDRITLESKELSLTVATDNYAAKIQGSSPDEFPIIPKLLDETNTIEVAGDVFKTALTQVLPSAASNDFKPEMNSVLLIVSGGSLKLVATDGFRLAEKTLSSNAYGTTIHSELRALIPLKTAQEVLRIFPGHDQLTVALDSNQVLFRSKDTALISRLIDGNYPEYGAIVPKNLTTELVVERDELIGAIKLVSNFSGKTSDLTLKVSDEQKAIEVYASSQTIGENSYQVSLKKKKLEGISKVSFNWRYLLDAVRVMPDPIITLGFTGESRPMMIKGTSDDSVFCIVMPIQQ